jgi:signal transduction histidine kinase
MGRVLTLFRSKILFKAVLIALLLLTYKAFENTRFDEIEYFIRDSLQYLNSIKEVDQSFVTLNININQDGVTTPQTHQGFKKIIEKIETGNPKNIVIMMEPLDFSEDSSEKRKIFELLEQHQNIFLNKSVARNETVTFGNDEVFKKYQRFVVFDRCMDSPKDRESRRAFLSFNSLGPAQIFEDLQKLGYSPRPIEYYKHRFEYWNTQQAFIKNYPLGTYGNFQSADLLSDRVNPSIFSGKTVIIGINNEFSMLTSRSIFNSLGTKRQTNIQASRVPLQDIYANILNFHTTGNYIHYLKNVDDLLLTLIILAILVVGNFSFIKKLYVFFSLMPMLIVAEVILFYSGSYYIDISRSCVVLFIAQYLVTPAILLYFFKVSEQRRLTASYNSRVDALLSLSTTIAHDLRSPLSTINLLVTKAQFLNSEHRDLVFGAVKRLESIIENMLKKYGTTPNAKTLETINLSKLITNILEEKKVEHAQVEFQITIPNVVTVKTDIVSIERVISNLLDNSIQALEKQQHKVIEVTLDTGKEFIVIKIRDNGPGIPAAILNLIGKEQITTKGPEKGNGIGLLHSKRLIEQLKGSLSVASSPNGGTVVTIQLPK